MANPFVTILLWAVCASSNNVGRGDSRSWPPTHLEWLKRWQVDLTFADPNSQTKIGWIEKEDGLRLRVQPPGFQPIDRMIVRRVADEDLQKVLSCSNLYSFDVMDVNFCYDRKFVMFKKDKAPQTVETDDEAVRLLSKSVRAPRMSDALQLVQAFCTIRGYSFQFGGDAAKRVLAPPRPEEPPHYALIGRIQDSWYIRCTLVTNQVEKKREMFSFQIETSGEIQLLRRKYLGQEWHVM